MRFVLEGLAFKPGFNGSDPAIPPAICHDAHPCRAAIVAYDDENVVALQHGAHSSGA
jgi:hypothetical protein